MFLESLAFLSLHYTKKSLDKINKCLEIYPEFVEALVIKSKILRGFNRTLEAN